MARAPLSILFGLGSLFERSSGPYLTTLQTGQELRRRGHNVSVIGTRSSRDAGPPQDWSGIHAVAFPRIGPDTLHFAPRAGHWLRRSKLRPDVVSLEGVWLHLFGKIAQFARKQNIPFMIKAHGNFNPVALNVSSWKKSLARHWFVDEMLERAACFHAITEQEYRWIREYGLRQPVCVIPNGVNLPAAGKPNSIPPEFRGRRTALYIGRLHHIKGLDLLLRAWADVASSHSSWQLIIAGNDDGAHPDLNAIRKSLHLESSVHFVGPVHGDLKAAWLAWCDFFVLASRSEGLPMAPLEAMSYGKPALLTTTCNFPEVAAGPGIEVACDVKSIAEGLRLMMNMDEPTRAAIGARGRELIERKYNWQVVCTELEQVYGWLAGRRAPPGTVRFD